MRYVRLAMQFNDSGHWLWITGSDLHPTMGFSLDESKAARIYNATKSQEDHMVTLMGMMMVAMAHHKPLPMKIKRVTIDTENEEDCKAEYYNLRKRLKQA